MKRLLVGIACGALAGAGLATDMEGKMKTVRSFVTAHGVAGELAW